MKKLTRRIIFSSRTARMTLPKEFLDTLGINDKEIVEVELKGKKIIITKIEKEEENND